AIPSMMRLDGLSGFHPDARPTKLPRTQAISVEVSSSPKVQGSAFQISSITGVGYIESEGPKSAVTTMRLIKAQYCSSSEPLSPNVSDSDWRSASTCAASI